VNIQSRAFVNTDTLINWLFGHSHDKATIQARLGGQEVITFFLSVSYDGTFLFWLRPGMCLWNISLRWFMDLYFSTICFDVRKILMMLWLYLAVIIGAASGQFYL